MSIVHIIKEHFSVVLKDAFTSNEYEKESNSQTPNAGERRNYGASIRLWDQKDPRVDQSFFQGGVPGFVLSSDQKIIDWNAGFELIFGSLDNMKRGMSVSNWYEHIDNFRRIPNREQQLYGESVLPITDRQRVVFLSPKYGRMVFMKMMSPVLDRTSGRIIGWNVALNINSVHERVQFFEELFTKISDDNKHARFIAGAEQVLMRSTLHHEFINSIVNKIGGSSRVLIVGAVKSEGLVESLLEDGLHRIVTVVDDDADALRLLKTRFARFHDRLRLIRRSILRLEGLPKKKFDSIVVVYPRLDESELRKTIEALLSAVISGNKIHVAGYSSSESSKSWWELVQSELERKNQLDVVKWHLQAVREEDQKVYSKAANLAQVLQLKGAQIDKILLGGFGSIITI